MNIVTNVLNVAIGIISNILDIMIPYVKKKVRSKKNKGKPDFESVFGIWKDRDITIENIRKKAWREVSK